jgi:hypothetical protein
MAICQPTAAARGRRIIIDTRRPAAAAVHLSAARPVSSYLAPGEPARHLALTVAAESQVAGRPASRPGEQTNPK